jgi:tRNA A37 threonylcarbamoyladenosine dehydratase
MAGKFHHEQLYRGTDALAKLAATRVTLCGAGALGSHLADNLVRQGLGPLRVIDRDRVEEHNVSTQLYGASEVGAWKVERPAMSVTIHWRGTWCCWRWRWRRRRSFDMSLTAAGRAGR